MYNRCVRLTRGILVLLEDRSAEEASILLRPLMEDAHALLHMSAHGAQSEGLALRYLEERVRKELTMHRETARGYGVEVSRNFVQGAENVLRDIRQRRDMLDPPPPPFPKLRMILRERDEEPLYWYWLEWSGNVHSSYLALNAYRYPPEESVLFRFSSLPEDVSRVAYFAGVFFARAVTAWVVLAGLASEEKQSELAALLDRMDDLVPEEEERRAN